MHEMLTRDTTAMLLAPEMVVGVGEEVGAACPTGAETTAVPVTLARAPPLATRAALKPAALATNVPKVDAPEVALAAE